MNGEATIQMPEQASTLAEMVDSLYYDIYWISVAFFLGIVGCMVYFAWRFRRRKGITAKPPGHHNALELFWTFSPLILLAYMFHMGFEGFMYMSVPPPNSINVRVRAYKWRWEFEQPNGLVDVDLVAPVGRPVRLVMGAVDNPPSADPDNQEFHAVLHSLFIPAFRVKRDVVPGMFTSMWFEATREGEFQIYCTEYCGTGHSRMLSVARIVSQCRYDAYLRRGPQRPDQYATDAEWGAALFAGNCTACHNVDPSLGSGVGPNLANVAGYPQPIEGGPDRIADLEYLRESLQQPQAAIVRGYTGASMPSFAGLAQSQIDALIAYIASLSDRGDQVELREAAPEQPEEDPCP